MANQRYATGSGSGAQAGAALGNTVGSPEFQGTRFRDRLSDFPISANVFDIRDATTYSDMDEWRTELEKWESQFKEYSRQGRLVLHQEPRTIPSGEQINFFRWVLADHQDREVADFLNLRPQDPGMPADKSEFNANRGFDPDYDY